MPHSLPPLPLVAVSAGPTHSFCLPAKTNRPPISFADRLLDGLDDLDWPESVKEMQVCARAAGLAVPIDHPSPPNTHKPAVPVPLPQLEVASATLLRSPRRAHRCGRQLQRNWIGKSVGAEVDFELRPPAGGRAAGKAAGRAAGLKCTVFTTRAETVGGAAAVVLAADHPLLAELELPAERREAVETFCAETAAAEAAGGGGAAAAAGPAGAATG